jgi:peptidylprolyl isomerase
MAQPRVRTLLTILIGFAACGPHVVSAPPPENAPAAVEVNVATPAVSASAAPAPVTSVAPLLSPEPAQAGRAVDAGVLVAAARKPDAIGEALSLQANLTYVDAVVGTGREAKDGDHVSVHCVGTLQDGTVFESSRAKKRPLVFVAGGDKVVVGLSQGIVGMRVGGRRTLTVPPALGYGRRGSGAKVPPSATLVFDVELLSVK